MRDINGSVEYHEHSSRKQHGGLNHWQIASCDGLKDEESKPRPVEDGLNEYHSANEVRGVAARRS